MMSSFAVFAQTNNQFIQFSQVRIPVAAIEKVHVNWQTRDLRILFRSQWNPDLKIAIEFQLTLGKLQGVIRPFFSRTWDEVTESTGLEYRVTSLKTSRKHVADLQGVNRAVMKLLHFFVSKGDPKAIAHLNEIVEDYGELVPLRNELRAEAENEIEREINFLINGPTQEQLKAWLVNLAFSYEIADEHDKGVIENLQRHLRYTLGDVSPRNMQKLGDDLEQLHHPEQLGESFEELVDLSTGNKFLKGSQFMHALKQLKADWRAV